MPGTCLIRTAHTFAHSFQDPPLVLPIQKSCELVQEQHLHYTESEAGHQSVAAVHQCDVTVHRMHYEQNRPLHMQAFMGYMPAGSA